MSIIKDVLVRFKGDASGVSRATKQVKGGIFDIKGQLKQLATGFAAAFAIGAIVKGAIKTIMEFDQAMANLQSITGESDAAMKQFSSSAIDLSKDFGTSASEIVEGFQLVKSSMAELDPQGVIEVTKAVDILATAAGLDMAEAAGALTQTMNQFGLSAEDAATTVDILATSQQKGTATINQLAESFKNVGAVANSAGLSFETTNAALQALAKGGLLGAEAGTGLRGVLLKLQSAGIGFSSGAFDMNDALTETRDRLNAITDPVELAQEKTKLFGLENVKVIDTLLAQQGVLESLDGTLNEHGNALDQATTNSDTLSGSMDKLGASWDAVILSAEDGDGVISGFFTNATQELTTFLGSVEALNEDGIDGIGRHLLGTIPAFEEVENSFRQLAEIGNQAVSALGMFEEVVRPIAGSVHKTQEEMFGVADAVDTVNKSLSKTVEKLSEVEQVIQGFKAQGLDFIDTDVLTAQVEDAVDGVGPVIGEGLQASIDQAGLDEALGEQFGAIMESGLENGVLGMADAIGAASAGLGGLSDVLGSAFKAIAGMMQQFGKALIAQGIATQALKVSFANPALAVAAGFGLVAAGAALKNIEIPSFASGTLGFGGGAALVGEFGPELVNLPAGASVKSNRQTQNLMQGGGRMTFVQRGESLIATADSSTRATRFVNGPSSAIGQVKGR